MSFIIRWEEPPPVNTSGRGGSRKIQHAAIAKELKENPGRWAVVTEGNDVSIISSKIACGLYKPYQPAGDFEACYRTIAGKQIVYARYLGDGIS